MYKEAMIKVVIAGLILAPVCTYLWKTYQASGKPLMTLNTRKDSTGQPAKGVWLIEKLPATVSLDNMGKVEKELVLHRYLQDRDACCETRIRAGNKGDGGWDVCLSGPYKPDTQSCKVYSFGIARDFSFDDAMGRRYNCEVKSFDPSSRALQKTYRRNKFVMFYDIGIDGKSFTSKAGWKLKTYSDLLFQFGDQNRTIDYLKIDVEAAEWRALPTMMKDGSLRMVKQMGLEIHRGRGKDMEQVYKLIDDLQQQGFRKWRVHYNPACAFTVDNLRVSRCIEIYFLNMNFVQRDSVKSGNVTTVCKNPTM